MLFDEEGTAAGSPHLRLGSPQTGRPACEKEVSALQKPPLQGMPGQIEEAQSLSGLVEEESGRKRCEANEGGTELRSSQDQQDAEVPQRWSQAGGVRCLRVRSVLPGVQVQGISQEVYADVETQ